MELEYVPLTVRYVASSFVSSSSLGFSVMFILHSSLCLVCTTLFCPRDTFCVSCTSWRPSDLIAACSESALRADGSNPEKKRKQKKTQRHQKHQRNQRIRRNQLPLQGRQWQIQKVYELYLAGTRPDRAKSFFPTQYHRLDHPLSPTTSPIAISHTILSLSQWRASHPSRSPSITRAATAMRPAAIEVATLQALQPHAIRLR
jgi:hypothetical protein